MFLSKQPEQKRKKLFRILKKLIAFMLVNVVSDGPRSDVL